MPMIQHILERVDLMRPILDRLHIASLGPKAPFIAAQSALSDLMRSVLLRPTDPVPHITIHKPRQAMQVLSIDTNGQHFDSILPQLFYDRINDELPKLRLDADRLALHQTLRMLIKFLPSPLRRRILVIPFDMFSMMPFPPPARIAAQPRAIHWSRHVEPPIPRARCWVGFFHAEMFPANTANLKHKSPKPTDRHPWASATIV